MEERQGNVSQSSSFCRFQTAQRQPKGVEELPLTPRNTTDAGGITTGPIAPANMRGADEWSWSSAVPRIYFLAS